jgi:aspartyl-tRNA(Asn)/glutamyl-tRNA(Gln) amidotransferase subunit A
MGASNENSSYGPVKNAADKSRVPGGSSGGSAVAVQADMCLAALGSDTGGSIRQPASFTGTIGLKPTYGRVSRYGLLAYASSFDQIGPITSSTSDAELIIQIMAGKDEMDATSSSTPVQKEPSLKPKLKIAIVKEAYHGEGLDPEVKSAMDRVFRKLREMGHVLEEVSYPNLKYMVPCYYVLTTAEASSNLSRYSGILYGHRSETAVDIDTTIKKSRTEGFGEEVKRRIMTGTFVLSEDFYEAYYNKAQKVRALIKSECEETLKEYDFVISPTAPTTAFKLGDKTLDPIQMYLADIFTVQASLAGLPAVSIPVGKDKHNLPIGLQIMGNAFEESSILKFADVILG